MTPGDGDAQQQAEPRCPSRPAAAELVAVVGGVLATGVWLAAGLHGAVTERIEHGERIRALRDGGAADVSEQERFAARAKLVDVNLAVVQRFLAGEDMPEPHEVLAAVEGLADGESAAAGPTLDSLRALRDALEERESMEGFLDPDLTVALELLRDALGATEGDR